MNGRYQHHHHDDSAAAAEIVWDDSYRGGFPLADSTDRARRTSIVRQEYHDACMAHDTRTGNHKPPYMLLVLPCYLSAASDIASACCSSSSISSRRR